MQVTPVEYVEIAVRCVIEKHKALYNEDLELNDPRLVQGVALSVLVDLGLGNFSEEETILYLKSTALYIRNFRESYLNQLEGDWNQEFQDLANSLDEKIVKDVFNKVKSKGKK